MLFWASLAHFITSGLPWPISSPWVSSAHSNSSFPWAFTESFRLPLPKLPYPLLSRFMGFSTNPLFTSLLWASLAHFCLLSISHNAHGFTTSFSGLLWASLLSLRPFYYFLGLWSIIPGIRVWWFFSLFTNSFPPIFLSFFLLLGLLAKVDINNL